MNYIKKERIESRTKYYRYRYLVECPICKQRRWITNYNKNSSLRCKVCAGRQSYTPSKVSRHGKRERGQGYITKQGYHLIYDGEKYIPAHRFAFPELPSNIVIHHIDGNKLNNSLENLIPLSKKDHRYAHGSLEKVSYLLIQSGLIEYDRDNNSYSLSSSMRKLVELISVNSEKPLTDDAEGNSEPSPDWGRCNDYPIEEYIRSLMEVRNTQTL